jgi:hypothetical protein
MTENDRKGPTRLTGSPPQFDIDPCYLCGRPIGTEDPTMDHVPPQRFFPQEIRHSRSLNLVTLKTHRDCHRPWGRDEEYVFNAILPLAMDSDTGKAAARDLGRSFRREAGQRLGRMVAREFEDRPSGLVLPGDLIIKRLDGQRLHRVMWKIARGVIFVETGRFIRESAGHQLQMLDARDEWPTWLIALMGEPAKGHSPDVFDYRIWLARENGVANALAMHFWERLTVWVVFHDPGCPCHQCSTEEDRAL